MITLYLKFCLRHVIYMMAAATLILGGAWAAVFNSTLDPYIIMIGVNVVLAVASILVSYFAFRNTLKDLI